MIRVTEDILIGYSDKGRAVTEDMLIGYSDKGYRGYMDRDTEYHGSHIIIIYVILG